MKQKKQKKPKKQKQTKSQKQVNIEQIQRNAIATLESRVKNLEHELVSALEEHGRALVQRNHAEEITQSFYNAIRRALGIYRRS